MKNIFFLFLVVFAVVSCDEFATEEQKAATRKAQAEEDFKDNINEAKDDLGNAFKNVGEALKDLKVKHNLKDGKEPINFREIKKVLPNRLAGMTMEDTEGQTRGFLGFKMSTVKGIYQSDDGQLNVKIVDVAGAGKLVSKVANWTDLDVDKESKDGYERTTVIDGYQAYEKYDSRRQKGQVALLVDDRFIIDIQGKNITERQLRDAMNDINIRKLKRLAK